MAIVSTASVLEARAQRQALGGGSIAGFIPLVRRTARERPRHNVARAGQNLDTDQLASRSTTDPAPEAAACRLVPVHRCWSWPSSRCSSASPCAGPRARRRARPDPLARSRAGRYQQQCRPWWRRPPCRCPARTAQHQLSVALGELAAQRDRVVAAGRRRPRPGRHDAAGQQPQPRPRR